MSYPSAPGAAPASAYPLAPGVEPPAEEAPKPAYSYPPAPQPTSAPAGGGGGLFDFLGGIGNVQSQLGNLGNLGAVGGNLGQLGGVLQNVDKLNKVATTAMQSVQAVQGVVKSVEDLVSNVVMEPLQGGAIIQLVCKSNNKCLQILMGAGSQLMLDGNGPEGQTTYNAHFTVVREPDNVVQIHNQFNFIAVSQGQVLLYPAGPNGHGTPNCRFKLSEPEPGVISLESIEEDNNFVSISDTGSISSPLATSNSDATARFTVKFIYNPYGPIPQANAV